MNWEDLTDDQQKAASSEALRLLVFGGAGSGKTTVALWCARCFLESPQAKSWHRVLFLTFSRTAVREISRRSGRALAGVRGFVEIQTFHGFASRILNSFGRYAGFGKDPPSFQSDAEARLLGRNEGHLVYDDLLPRALEAVRVPRVKRLLSERWPVVICDEFQDTDDMQWELLWELAEAGRLVLFADPNQMIYDGFLGHRGVGPKRVEQARGLADLVLDLGAPSHRDPTNIIPAMAAAVRRRWFNDPAVEAALEQDRLRIHAHVTDELLIETLRTEIADAGSIGARTVGIFGHGNQGVAGLSAELFRAGVDHVLIGLPEAHGEAFAALEGLCLYGLGRTGLAELKLRLAVFLTASVRGNQPPALAIGLIGKSPLPAGLPERIDAASQALCQAAEHSFDTLIHAASEVWPRLGITAGRRHWHQASRTFGAIAQQASIRSRGREDEFVAELGRRLSEQRSAAFFDLDVEVGPIQLMNFHQTKGREADIVILVYRDDDWFGKEAEPFSRNSRLLYVALTRARLRDVVILPLSPHPLVAPFAKLAADRSASRYAAPA